MLHRIFFALTAVFCCFFAQAQVKNTIGATRISTKIKIDAQLDEAVWTTLPVAKKFVQYEPKPDIPAIFDTEVKIAYDDQAIYIGALLRDPNPDSILHELTQRDVRMGGNFDAFGVMFDTYRDGNNAQMFRLSAAGVQIDSRYLYGNREDLSWNVVWKSATQITPEGWVVEMAIPFSALRFANAPVQSWNVNFFRSIRRYRHETAWNPIDPTNVNIVQQCGTLQNIENIKSPLRLSATPYTAAYAEKQSTVDGGNYNLNAGMDIKYGINDAFTLDMTLVPDFGQVQFDNQVLNLTPFEVRFDENRPFFTEGTELFSKGNLLYSRRIGAQNFYKTNDLKKNIAADESIVNINPQPRLLNATKISGRTTKGLGLGFFNAIENRDYAQIIDTQGKTLREVIAHPLTNYNVVVADKNLKNSSFITFVNTNVTRAGKAYDANVTGTEMSFRNKANRYMLNLGGAIHQRFFTDSTDYGHKWHADFSKVYGQWQWGLHYNEESTRYNPNDLGFLIAPNERSSYLNVTYGKYKPFGKFNRFTAGGLIDYGRLYAPNVFTGLNFSANAFWQTRKIFSFGGNISGNFVNGRDYFLPQTSDFKDYFRSPKNIKGGWFISSDYRKPWAWDAGMTLAASSLRQQLFTYYFSPRRRFNDKISLVFRNQVTWQWRDIGRFSLNKNSLGYDNVQSSDIIMGYRNRVTIENALTLKYSFNANAGISIRAREYWSAVDYTAFAKLSHNGTLANHAYQGRDINNIKLHDLRYNLANIDIIYTWRFAPGSDIFLTYKNYIFGVSNNLEKSYLYDLKTLLDASQTNSISLKLIYFIDYQYFNK